MRKRNGRIEAILGEIMPLAHAMGNPLSFDSDLNRIQTDLYNLLCARDEEAFEAVLETFRAEGLVDLWQLCWDQATEMACAKSYENGFRSLLIAVPFLTPWTGTCNAAERKALTKVLKQHQLIPPRGKVQWLLQPQSIYHLRATSPLQLWILNTPGASSPYSWGYSRMTVPGMHLLVGRLEFPEQNMPRWPDPEQLARDQREALGWPEGTLDACAPLHFFLDVGQDEAETEEDHLLEISLTVLSALKKQVEEEHLSAEDCTVCVEARSDNRVNVTLQPKHHHNALLCNLEYNAARINRLALMNKIEQVLTEYGFSVEAGASLVSQPTRLH